MMVDHALAKLALDQVGGVVPRFPKVKVTLASPNADGYAEMTIEGSAHASEEDVAGALGLPVGVAGRIRKTTPSTVGFVVSEPGREPSPGALASRGRVKRTSPPKALSPNVIEANTATRPKTRKRASTAGRRKK